MRPVHHTQGTRHSAQAGTTCRVWRGEASLGQPPALALQPVLLENSSQGAQPLMTPPWNTDAGDSCSTVSLEQAGPQWSPQAF